MVRYPFSVIHIHILFMTNVDGQCSRADDCDLVLLSVASDQFMA